MGLLCPDAGSRGWWCRWGRGGGRASENRSDATQLRPTLLKAIAPTVIHPLCPGSTFTRRKHLKLESVCQPLLRGTQGTVIKALSVHGRCVIVIRHPRGELAAHRAGLVTVPVSMDSGEQAWVCDQGDRSWHVWVRRRANRGVLVRNTCPEPRASSQAAFFVLSRAPEHAAAAG